MKISTVINSHNRYLAPYTKRGLVNHLPMGQLALYQMTKDLEKVEEYSKEYLKNTKILKVKKESKQVNSIEECLGNKELYGSCIDLLEEIIKREDIEKLLKYILNKYPLGISSGLFHTLIRLGYAVEGYKIDSDLKEELVRAMAYYITGYKEADVFDKSISKDEFISKVKGLEDDEYIKTIVKENDTLGTRLRSLYNDEYYMKEGVIIEGDEYDKTETLLDLLIQGFESSRNILLLHCITAVHGLYMLKDYFHDYNKAIDILTTTIVTHILTLDKLRLNYNICEVTEQSWDCIKTKASESENIHSIKLAYSTCILDKIYDIPELKEIALRRIRRK